MAPLKPPCSPTRTRELDSGTEAEPKFLFPVKPPPLPQTFNFVAPPLFLECLFPLILGGRWHPSLKCKIFHYWFINLGDEEMQNDISHQLGRTPFPVLLIILFRRSVIMWQYITSCDNISLCTPSLLLATSQEWLDMRKLVRAECVRCPWLLAET